MPDDAESRNSAAEMLRRCAPLHDNDAFIRHLAFVIRHSNLPRMTLTPDLATKGIITHVSDGGATLVFHPHNTNYMHQLVGDGSITAASGLHVNGVIHVKARKVYTVPSGGGFVQPVLGSPRIIQGRVISLDEKSIVVKAGATFVVELPTGLDTIDLHTGAIHANSLVNVVAFPGAMFERVG